MAFSRRPNPDNDNARESQSGVDVDQRTAKRGVRLRGLPLAWSEQIQKNAVAAS